MPVRNRNLTRMVELFPKRKVKVSLSDTPTTLPTMPVAKEEKATRRKKHKPKARHETLDFIELLK